jgi:hypothetical protein
MTVHLYISAQHAIHHLQHRKISLSRTHALVALSWWARLVKSVRLDSTDLMFV